MKRRRIAYSAAELAFIEARAGMARRALHAEFVREFGRDDVTIDHIKSLCTRNDWLTRERWTEEEDATLRARYPDTRTEDLARELGRSLSSTFQRAYSLGLEKSAAFRASPASGRTNGRQGIGTRFTKGSVPHNKGKVCEPGRGGRHPNAQRTQFKKGERTGIAVALYKPIGSERLSKEGYLERKINDDFPAQRRWRGVHLIEWEAINGPLPKGHALKCLDGNKRNTEPSNWLLVSRALLPRLNGKHGRGFDTAPAELKPAILAIAKLEHAANEADGLTPTQRMIEKRRQRSRRSA